MIVSELQKAAGNCDPLILLAQIKVALADRIMTPMDVQAWCMADDLQKLLLKEGAASDVSMDS